MTAQSAVGDRIASFGQFISHIRHPMQRRPHTGSPESSCPMFDVGHFLRQRPQLLHKDASALKKRL